MREPTFHVAEASAGRPLSRRALVLRSAAIGVAAMVLGVVCSLTLDAIRAHRAGKAFAWWDAAGRIALPVSAGDVTTLVAVVVVGALTALATAAGLAARSVRPGREPGNNAARRAVESIRGTGEPCAGQRCPRLCQPVRRSRWPRATWLSRQREAIPAPVAERGLVDECRRGDAKPSRGWSPLHEGMVFNLAARLLGDPEEAQDLAQDVFLQVYRTLARFEGRSSLKTWIYRIVVNQCRNRQRWWRRRRRDQALPDRGADAVGERAARVRARRTVRRSSWRGASSARARAERAARLSFDHRAILLLREVEGLSCEEIAQALGVPEGTVKSRLARARDALRDALYGAWKGRA